MKNCFCKLLKVHRFSEVKQIEIRVHMAEPLVTVPSPFEVESDIVN